MLQIFLVFIVSACMCAHRTCELLVVGEPFYIVCSMPSPLPSSSPETEWVIVFCRNLTYILVRPLADFMWHDADDYKYCVCVGNCLIISLLLCDYFRPTDLKYKKIILHWNENKQLLKLAKIKEIITIFERPRGLILVSLNILV